MVTFNVNKVYGTTVLGMRMLRSARPQGLLFGVLWMHDGMNGWIYLREALDLNVEDRARFSFSITGSAYDGTRSQTQTKRHAASICSGSGVCASDCTIAFISGVMRL
jgi:hypothetical protein